MDLQQLQELRETVHASVRNLEDMRSTRALSTNQAKALEKYLAQRDELDEQITEMRQQADPDRQAAIEARQRLEASVLERGRLVRSFPGNGTEQRSLTDVQHGELRSFGLGDEMRDALRTTGEPSLAAVVRGMAMGDWSHMTAEQRSLVSLGAAAAIPGASVLAIQEQAMQQSVVFNAGARIVNIERPSEKVARVISTGTPEWLPDTTDRELTDQAITISPADLTAHSAWLYTSVSIETLEDATGLEAAIQDAFARQLAILYDEAALAGTGSDMPKGLGHMTAGADGILQMPGVGVLTGHTPFVQAAGKVLAAHHKPTSVMIDSDVWTELATLTDTLGQPIQPPKAYVDLSEHVSDFLLDGDAIVADWSKWLFGTRTAVTLEVSRTGAGFSKGFVEIRAYVRFGGMPVDPAAFCRLSGIEAAASV